MPLARAERIDRAYLTLNQKQTVFSLIRLELMAKKTLLFRTIEKLQKNLIWNRANDQD